MRVWVHQNSFWEFMPQVFEEVLPRVRRKVRQRARLMPDAIRRLEGRLRFAVGGLPARNQVAGTCN